MKTKLLRYVVLTASVLATVALVSEEQKPGLKVHEWGTFTSLQGSDGVPLKWHALKTSELPGFVYNWYNAGFGRFPISPLLGSVFSKGGAQPTLQRMETPVIYFYSDREQTVDVNVGFPDGLITEWYPQAETVGPSAAPPSSTTVKLDDFLTGIHMPTNVRASAIFGDASVTNSVIGWKNIKVFASTPGRDATARLRTDTSGSHYFAARHTDSAELLVETSYKTNHTSEHEKFLFYRGLGNFGTPLSVRMPADSIVTIANSGAEPLRHLFVLTLSHGRGTLMEIDSLDAHTESNVSFRGNVDSADELVRQISARMADALVKEGLYPREATAMVNTWKDSWFAEEGTRVLYVLPRAWTDKTLPLHMSPAPSELVRVMVGRAEVLSPAIERALAKENPPGTSTPGPTVLSLGRFGGAALQRANSLASKPQQVPAAALSPIPPQ